MNASSPLNHIKQSQPLPPIPYAARVLFRCSRCARTPKQAWFLEGQSVDSFRLPCRCRKPLRFSCPAQNCTCCCRSLFEVSRLALSTFRGFRFGMNACEKRRGRLWPSGGGLQIPKRSPPCWVLMLHAVLNFAIEAYQHPWSVYVHVW